MSIPDPAFGSTLASGCPFDCEPRARQAAARTVDLEIPEARSRLVAVRKDELEEDGR